MIRSVIQTTMASSLRAGLKTTPSSSVLLQLSKNLTTKAFANSLLAQHPKNQVASVRCLGRLPARFSSTQAVNQGEAVKENIETIVVEPPRKDVAAWLFVVAGLVFAMVVIGGLTRLTKSGLSMVHWKFTGEDRPITQEDWDAEFEKYKESPEYKLHNVGMSLEEFKFIYYMEYGHRTLGRVIGLVFGGGLAYFLSRGRVPIKSGLAKMLTVLLGLGGFQGFIGWWMVRSGLDPEENKVKANVSPYRLATHLISAFILYTMLMATGLRCYHGRTRVLINGIRQKAGSKSLNKVTHITAGLVLLTAFSGAFVAGNDAGLIYNEFPLMGGRVVPSDLINPYLNPSWKNIFENPTFVQFTHRCLAMSTAIGVISTWWLTRGKGSNTPVLKRAANYLLAAVTLQVALGITTLLGHVPVPLAAGHQAGALLLMTAATNMMFVLMNPAVAGTIGLATAAAGSSSGAAALLAVSLFEPSTVVAAASSVSEDNTTA